MRDRLFGWDYPPGVTGNEPEIVGAACDICNCSPCQCDALMDKAEEKELDQDWDDDDDADWDDEEEDDFDDWEDLEDDWDDDD